MKPFKFTKTDPLRDIIQLGKITSLVLTKDDTGFPTSTKNGLYNVLLTHTGRELENVAAVQDSYNYNSNTGIIRLYEKDEPVLVVRIADGRFLIIGSALLAGEDNNAPLPRVGSFGNPLSPGELYIGGVSKDAPVERSSFLHFDKVGNINLSSNNSYIKFKNSSGMISMRSARHEQYNEAGFEAWGPHGMVGTMVPAGLPKPGKWRRLVRAVASNNYSPFVYTSAGSLGISTNQVFTDPTTPIYMQNINNAAVVLGTMGGSYSISAGLPPTGTSLGAYEAYAFPAIKPTAPLTIDLDPLKATTTVRGPVVDIKGGLTGTEGVVLINALNVNTNATSAINLTSGGIVAITGTSATINAPITTFTGNVVITGTLTVNGPTTVPSTITTGYLNAPNVVRV